MWWLCEVRVREECSCSDVAMGVVLLCKEL